MALLNRVARFRASLRQERLDERTRVGVDGEEHATAIIASANPQCHVANAIVPSMHPGGRVHETDHVVLIGGTVFIVEVKNYKGRIVWENSTHRGLLQLKTGRHGELTEPKKAKNPLLQAFRYIYPAKQYLSRVCDRRFERLRMEPVGAFTRNADITAIRSVDDGIVYMDELPAFFASRRNDRFAGRPSDWIINGFEELARLDVVKTKAVICSEDFWRIRAWNIVVRIRPCRSGTGRTWHGLSSNRLRSSPPMTSLLSSYYQASACTRRLFRAWSASKIWKDKSPSMLYRIFGSSHLRPSESVEFQKKAWEPLLTTKFRLPRKKGIGDHLLPPRYLLTAGMLSSKQGGLEVDPPCSSAWYSTKRLTAAFRPLHES